MGKRRNNNRRMNEMSCSKSAFVDQCSELAAKRETAREERNNDKTRNTHTLYGRITSLNEQFTFCFFFCFVAIAKMGKKLSWQPINVYFRSVAFTLRDWKFSEQKHIR